MTFEASLPWAPSLNVTNNCVVPVRIGLVTSIHLRKVLMTQTVSHAPLWISLLSTQRSKMQDPLHISWCDNLWPKSRICPKSHPLGVNSQNAGLTSRAFNSCTLLAEQTASKNTVLKVKCFKLIHSIGSKGGFAKVNNTVSKSQVGVESHTGFFLIKAPLTKSFNKGCLNKASYLPFLCL